MKDKYVILGKFNDIKATPNSLIVNGKNVEDTQFRQYIKDAELRLGKPLKKNFKVIIQAKITKADDDGIGIDGNFVLDID